MKKLTKILLLALAFLPLVNDSSIFFPSSASKVFFFKSLVLAAIISFTLSLILDREFRKESTQKLISFIKNPLFIAIASFIAILIVSTIFALDKYSAFWGHIQRGDGLVGAISLFALFLLALLNFEKRDWLTFFKLTIVTSLILLGKVFIEFAQGVSRPPSFVGNPTFLAGYLIFSMFASFLLLHELNKGAWRRLALLTLVLSPISIFITQTRGTILGLAVGLLVIFVYLAAKERGLYYKKINIRKLSAIILLVVIIFSAIFLATKNNQIWQKVPGLARIANISTEDKSTKTRLLSTQYSIDAVNPAKSGIKNLALGWGPNNYVLAFAKNYQLEHYKYEKDWLDKAHNEPLNVLVENGLLGLIAYLLIWFFFLRGTLWVKEFSLEKIAYIFYGSVFFVHLLFVFDQTVSIVPFFLTLAFALHTSSDSTSQAKPNKGRPTTLLAAFLLITIFLSWVFIKNDFPAYMQMREYTKLKSSNGSTERSRDSVFEPFTFAQTTIRRDFLSNYQKRQDTRTIQEEALLNIAFTKAEEYKNKRPYDFRFTASLAAAYQVRANETENTELLKKGEEYLRHALTFAPNRPSYQFQLAVNLMYQGRSEEAFPIVKNIMEEDPELADSYYYYGLLLWIQDEDNHYQEAFNNFEKAFDMSLEEDLFLRNKADIGLIYDTLFQKFYNLRSQENVIKAAQRMIKNGHAQSDALQKIIDSVEQGIWPDINFGQSL
ncbi:MAG: O-antigen ligase family protein [bacterium]|nr:O-antigen ligase family protein [bacterium]